MKSSARDPLGFVPGGLPIVNDSRVVIGEPPRV
jgi:hypothetical protein